MSYCHCETNASERQAYIDVESVEVDVVYEETYGPAGGQQVRLTFIVIVKPSCNMKWGFNR